MALEIAPGKAPGRRVIETGGVAAPGSPVSNGTEDVIRRLRESFHYRGFTDFSPELSGCIDKACAYAQMPAPVLITGETGTGKRELVNTIHRASGRTGDLVTLDCSNIPTELLLSNLFGHSRGAFTGAVRDHDGLVEDASEGTLYIDEVENLPPSVQQQLLMALDSKTGNLRYRRVGESTVRDVKTRVVCATNVNLGQLVREGKFRADLYYRIRALHLHVPALRERGQDHFYGLVHHLLKYDIPEQLHGIHGLSVDPITIGGDVMEMLYVYPWPGNVRQLISVLTEAATSAVIMRSVNTITVEDLPSEFISRIGEFSILLPRVDGGDFEGGEHAELADISVGGLVTFFQCLIRASANASEKDIDALVQSVEALGGFDAVEKAMQKILLVVVVKHYGGNLSGTAEALGITRRILKYKLNALGVIVNT
ncbi:MAG: sigma 54-interacting transcriptional regulator [Patescibacteria group bacterium]